MDDFMTNPDRPEEETGSSLNRAYTQETADGYYNADTIGFAGMSGDTEFVTLLKGILGAIIGSLPGMLLIIFLSRFGLLASVCGVVMAAGAIYGYTRMTRDSFLDIKYGVIVVIAVMLLGIYLGVRISWAWRFSVEFPKLYELSYDILVKSFTESGFSKEEAEKLFNLIFDDPDRGFFTYFFNFGDYLQYPGSRVKFGLSLFGNYVFAASGSAVIFRKFIMR